MSEASQRELDNNGFMLIRGCPLSTEGIYEYSAGQIGLDGDPNRIVKVYRPMSSVMDPEAINSFKNVPFIDEHEMLNGLNGAHPEYTAPEEKGIDGVLTQNVYFDESTGWMRGDVKVFTRKALEAITQRKDDLSLGFGCRFKIESGTWRGQAFEVIQFAMRGNHLALVEEGRIEGARILDAMCFDSLNFDFVIKNNEELIMDPKIINGIGKDSAMAKLQAMIPALQGILAECGGAAPAADPVAPAADPAATVDAPAAATTAAPAAVVAPAADAPADDVPAAPAAASADPAADPVADPATPDDPAAVGVLVNQIEDLLAQVKATIAPAADPVDPPVEAAPATEDSLDPSTTAAIIGDANMDPKEMPAQDAAFKGFYKEQATKTKLYDGISKVIGAFDHAIMDSKSVAQYGLKKLGLTAKPGEEISTVEVYLRGLGEGQKAVADTTITQRAAMDSRNANPSLDAWIQGE